MIVKAQRKRDKVTRSIAAGKKPVFATRTYNSCLNENCGRVRGYIRIFGLCRMCLRDELRRGNVPGVKKSSW